MNAAMEARRAWCSKPQEVTLDSVKLTKVEPSQAKTKSYAEMTPAERKAEARRRTKEKLAQLAPQLGIREVPTDGDHG